MALILIMVLVLAGGLIIGLTRRRLVALLSGLWLGGFVLVLVLPGQFGRVLGWDWRAMLGATILVVLGGTYWWGVGLMRRRSGVAALRREADLARAQGNVLAATAKAEHARQTAAQMQGSANPADDATTSDGPENQPHAFDDNELDRYMRHIVLREIGGTGQRALRDARVLIVGAGGLGAPLCLYLAGAGVGRILLADDDQVDLSNLHRQVIFTTRDAANQHLKAEAAAKAMAALNPHCRVELLHRRITADDADLIAGFDLILDGTDSFASRDAVNRACVKAGVPLIAGSIAQWDGQVTVYDPARNAPCMACLFPDPPAPGTVLDCASAGVAGPLPGIIGTMMAMEAVKLLTGAGQPLRGRMLIWDGLGADARTITIHRNADCPVCGGLSADDAE